MKKIILLILLLFLLSGAGKPKQECDFRNTKWGMSKEDIKKNEKVKLVKESDLFDSFNLEYEDSIDVKTGISADTNNYKTYKCQIRYDVLKEYGLLKFVYVFSDLTEEDFNNIKRFFTGIYAIKYDFSETKESIYGKAYYYEKDNSRIAVKPFLNYIDFEGKKDNIVEIEFCSYKYLEILNKALEDINKNNKVIEERKVEDEQGVTVYITKTGAKYHRLGCRYLSKSCIPIKLKDAQLGYSPCSVCRPPQ